MRNRTATCPTNSAEFVIFLDEAGPDRSPPPRMARPTVSGRTPSTLGLVLSWVGIAAGVGALVLGSIVLPPTRLASSLLVIGGVLVLASVERLVWRRAVRAEGRRTP